LERSQILDDVRTGRILTLDSFHAGNFVMKCHGVKVKDLLEDILLPFLRRNEDFRPVRLVAPAALFYGGAS
jgi:hypothetical protein